MTELWWSLGFGFLSHKLKNSEELWFLRCHPTLFEECSGWALFYVILFFAREDIHYLWNWKAIFVIICKGLKWRHSQVEESRKEFLVKSQGGVRVRKSHESNHRRHPEWEASRIGFLDVPDALGSLLRRTHPARFMLSCHHLGILNNFENRCPHFFFFCIRPYNVGSQYSKPVMGCEDPSGARSWGSWELCVWHPISQRLCYPGPVMVSQPCVTTHPSCVWLTSSALLCAMRRNNTLNDFLN